MKVFVLVMALSCFAPVADATSGKPVETESSISAVTVYEDRALVTRRAELKLEPGLEDLVLRRLPAMIFDDSVRASGSGTARVTILGVEVRREFLKEAMDERVKTLQDEIEKMQDEDTALKDRAAAVGIQIKFLESIKSSVGEQVSREMLMRAPDPGAWKGVVGFLGKEYGALSPELRETQKKRRDLAREITAAKRKLKEIITLLPREQKTVTVSLDISRGGSLDLDLSYVVSGAGWKPCYDARAERAGETVGLTYCGRVSQGTGEDWNDVSLELSTARPSIGGTPPELFPWYISYARPPRPMMKRMAAAPMALEVAEGEGAAMKADKPLRLEDALVAQAEVGRRGEAVTFRIKKRDTVPGDRSVHKVVIAPLTMKAEYGYLAVPRLAEHAYLMARVVNDAGYPLRAGRVEVFLGAEYVGTSSLKYVAPGEKFDLYLGVDGGVTVKRKLVQAGTERSLVRRRTGWKNYRYRIEVENHRGGKEAVTVLDQIPVSRAPDIVVKLEEAAPEPVTIAEREKPGVLSWKLELDPGRKKTIEYEFSVSYPKEKEIDGLD